MQRGSEIRSARGQKVDAESAEGGLTGAARRKGYSRAGCWREEYSCPG